MKNPYFKLLLKLLLFIVFVVLIDQIIGLGFNYIKDKAYEKNQFSNDLISRYCIEDAIPEIAIIGSSTANHHYIPQSMEDSLGLSVYNFGKDGSFLYYQCAMIDLMIERYTPKYIIWEVGESVLSSNYNDRYEYQNMNDLYLWYRNHYVKDIVDRKDRFQKIRMLSKSYINNSQLFTCLRLCFGRDNDVNLFKGYVPLNYSVNDQFPSKPIKNQYKDYSMIPEKIDILNQTIGHCQKKGISIVFTSSPRYFYDYVKNTDYYQKIREIAIKNNIPYIDYYNVEPFCDDSTFFRDNAHLNSRGTELYMSMFIPELKQIIQANNNERDKD